ncbi:MAG: sialidase family protein [Actinomycetota bacterium]
MAVDSHHNIYISSIIGFSNSTSLLWKSEDGGESFDLLRQHVPTNAAPTVPGVGGPDLSGLDAPFNSRPTKTLGGGDSALIIGPPAPGHTQDTLMFIDLEGLASFGSAVSFDGGNTFTNDNVFSSGSEPYGDRQWGGVWRDHSGVDHYYNFYNGLNNNAPSVGGPVGPYTFSIIETTDYGKTWTDWKRGVTANPGRSRPGPLMVDQKTGDLMLTWTYSSGNTGGAGFTRCVQATKTCKDTVIATMPGFNTNNTFVTGARDRAGNLYVAWSAIPNGPPAPTIPTSPNDVLGITQGPSNIPTRIYVATSTNKGVSWSKPVVVSGALPTASMPSIVAGDTGRVSVAYYATMTPGDPNYNSGPWNVYMSQSIDALSKHPTYSVTRVSEHPNHVNPICTQGLGCTVNPDQMNNRNLADFLYAAIGPRGETYVTWADTANQIGPNPPAGPPIDMFAKQVQGPSLYANPGTLDEMKPGVDPFNGTRDQVNHVAPVNWSYDPDHDAYVPRHSPSGPGADNSALDLTTAWMEPESGGLKATMYFQDAFQMNVPNPYSALLYMLWWWSHGKVHYVAAEIGPQQAGISDMSNHVNDCYAGEPSYSNAYSTRWALYTRYSVPPPTVTSINCDLDQTYLQHGKLTFHIPLSAIGAVPGDRLYSVTASSSLMLQADTAVNAINNLPVTIDSLAPFGYTVGQPRLSIKLKR